MKRSREHAQSPRYKGRAMAAAGLLILSSVACQASGQDMCRSPRAVSPEIAGNLAADPADQDSWSYGIIATTDLPPSASGIVAAYQLAGSSAYSETSPLIRADKAGSIGLLVGQRSVRFSLQLQAPAGSAACDAAPVTDFSEAMHVADIASSGAVVAAIPGAH